MTLQDLVDEYVAKEAATGLFAPDDQVLQSCIEATRFYAGYAALRDPTAAPDEFGSMDLADITAATNLTAGEWAIIAPLFRLYVERQAAQVVEASRGLGVEALGRSTSEVAADIQRIEEALPLLAFSEEPFTVGLPPEEV